MRILRGKSNLEVSSQGFAWFVVGLVIATFVGGAVRTLLTSDRVHQRIVTELRNRFPHQEFTIGPTEILLSRGMWPGLGLRVRNLSFRQDVCGKLSFKIDVPQAVLPVDLFAFRKGKMRLGRVELSDGLIHLNYVPCPEEKSAAATGVPVERKKPVLSAPSLNWNKVSEHLNAIDLNHFTITYARNVTWKVLIPSMQFDFDGDVAAQGAMEIQKSLPFGTLSHTVEIEAQGDNRVLQWGAHAEFKEGHFQVKGSLDLNTHAAQVGVFARQLPMKDVMSELHQMGFAERDLKLKAAWLTCALKWEGPVEKPETSPLLAHECKIEGGYGRLDLNDAEVWLDHPAELKKPAVLKLTKIQMQPLLEALGREVLPKVLARPGIWSGELSYTTPETWSLDGRLEAVEVVFSNRSVRGKQALERLHTRVKRTSSRIEATVDQLEIRGGEFDGELKFALADDWRNGEFRANIEKLRFGSQIQTLLTGGTLGNLKCHGQGQLSGGELARWEGDFELDRAQGPGWETEGLKVQSKFQPGVFQLEGRARLGRIHPDWALYPQLREVRPEASGVVDWNDLRARVEITSNGGTLNSVTGVESVSKQTWRLVGNWIRDGEFDGVLSIGTLKPRSFTLNGEKGSLSVQERLR